MQNNLYRVSRLLILIDIRVWGKQKQFFGIIPNIGFSDRSIFRIPLKKIKKYNLKFIII